MSGAWKDKALFSKKFSCDFLLLAQSPVWLPSKSGHAVSGVVSPIPTVGGALVAALRGAPHVRWGGTDWPDDVTNPTVAF